MLERKDAREAIKIPLGVVPGGIYVHVFCLCAIFRYESTILQTLFILLYYIGTGNALSVSLLGEEDGFDPVHAALQVVKGKG